MAVPAPPEGLGFLPVEKLKHILDEEIVLTIATDLRRVCPRFDTQGFSTAAVVGLRELELTARARHIAEAMVRYLPRPFSAAAEVLVSSLGPEIPPTGQNGLAPLRYMPHVYFIEKNGLDDFETAMWAQYELTKRFSAEWSIRAFIEKYPEETYKRLLKWARDENAHVRRLVSEGTRPRLPWARRLRSFQQDPTPVITLLEILKDDPERYVQRSVANNLNDIGKDHPDLVADLCRRWSVGAPPGRQWTVRHALRSLVKAGHRGALEVMGAGAPAAVAVRALQWQPKTVRLGDALHFSFEIASTATHEQDLVVDYAVHFVRANGATPAKVFKLKRIALAPLGRAMLRGIVSFREMSTRRFYPGAHRIEARINGEPYPLMIFDVISAEPAKARLKPGSVRNSGAFRA